MIFIKSFMLNVLCIFRDIFDYVSHVSGEVDATTCRPGLALHEQIPIDARHVDSETDADKENCKSDCCHHHRQPAWDVLLWHT